MDSCLIRAGWRALRVERSTGPAGPKDLRNAMNNHHVGLHYSEADERDLVRGAAEVPRGGRVDRGSQTWAGRWTAADGFARTIHFVQAYRNWSLRYVDKLALSDVDSGAGRKEQSGRGSELLRVDWSASKSVLVRLTIA